MCMPERFPVHLLYFAVIGQVAVDLDLHICRLGVNRRRQSLGDERFHFIFQQRKIRDGQVFL